MTRTGRRWAALSELLKLFPEEDRPQEAAADVQLGRYVQQLGRIVAQLMQHMEDMERQNARQITVDHDTVKAIQGRIRQRAGQLCEMYSLPAAAQAPFRAAMKKDVLGRWAVKDLHDLPLAALDGAMRQIDGYANYALAMEQRRKARGTEEAAAAHRQKGEGCAHQR